MKRTRLRKISPKKRSETQRLKRLRKACFDEYGEYCIMCGTPYGVELEHIWTQGAYPQWRYVLENTRPVCGIHGNDCHGKKHNDVDFRIKYYELTNAYELKEEFMRGVGTVIE